MCCLEQALSWSKFRPVFPAYEVDTWNGGNLHMTKSPATKRGHLDATQDEQKIRQWWAESPNRLVGVWIGDDCVVLDIDLDLEKAEDGFHFLTENALELPESFAQSTPSGGQHIFYRNPGASLGPRNNYLSPNQVIRTGLDRKTGSSYVIAYEEAAPKLELLADAPEWLCVPTTSIRQQEYSGTLEDWLLDLNPLIADYRVIDAMKRFPMEDFDHQVMITKQTALVLLGAAGHPGIPEALDLLQALWLFGEFDTEEYRIEWTVALEGAVRKFGGRPSVGGAN